jgi:hypothetical protein
MRRSLILLALATGFVTGLVSQSGGGADPTGQLYQTWITAPTGSGPPVWEEVTISCGWHTGDCRDNVDGQALDWNDQSSQGRNVNVRGFFKRSNSPYDIIHLRGHIRQMIGGPGCDIIEAIVTELYGDWHYRWSMRYVHANRSGERIFAIPVNGDPTGIPSYWFAGSMIDDRPCPWTDYHVHDYAFIDHAYPKALPGWLDNRTDIPVVPGSRTWPTFGWSRYFEWAEGYP